MLPKEYSLAPNGGGNAKASVCTLNHHWLQDANTFRLGSMMASTNFVFVIDQPKSILNSLFLVCSYIADMGMDKSKLTLTRQSIKQ